MTILTDQVVSDMWEDLFSPPTTTVSTSGPAQAQPHDAVHTRWAAPDLDVAPNINRARHRRVRVGYTHTEEGYDIEEMEAQWRRRTAS